MTRPKLTVTAAVEAFEVERRTLQRLLAKDQLPGAIKDDRGRWMIPVEALQASGFTARQTWLADATNRTTRHDSDATTARQTASNQRTKSAIQGATNGTTRNNSDATARDNDATDLRQRVARLEEQLDAEKRLREAAERNAEDLRSAMRMIEAGQPQTAQPASSDAPRRRSWWRRT